MLMRYLLILFTPLFVFAQSEGSLHGNVQIDAQYYAKDTAIGAVVPKEKLASNSFVNLIYNKGVFTGGLRYEAYLPALQGFDQRYSGNQIAYRFAQVKLEDLTFKLGNFYEQFGSGILLRTYEERGLGYDNAFDGASIAYRPNKSIQIKGLIGKQRKYFVKSVGTVRGLDIEYDLTQSLDSLLGAQQLRLGASFVSKYQVDNNSTYNLPENVGSYALRADLSGKKYRLFSEFAYKMNDPSANNEFIFKSGNALITQFSYFQKGLGFSLDFKRVDNMSFRSEREAVLADVLINYSPSFTRQHTYNLLATLYPYATQLNGEIGGQAELNYKFKKNTALGGKYGTTVLLNFSTYYDIERRALNDLTTSRQGYESSFFNVGEHYFSDFNIQITKKLSKKVKGLLTYANLHYNKDVLEGKSGYGIVKSHIGVIEATYKIKPKHAIRTELQGLFTEQDQGDWATLLVEYTIAPHWFFALMDQYNYGNKDVDKRQHYYVGSFGYSKDTYRFLLSYGRQRAGIFCVGGVCRNVPAANGLTLTFMSNF